MSTATALGSALERRRRTAQELAAALPPCAPFDAWAAAARELPPDFARLPARTSLWSPVDGVPDAAAWAARRALLRARWRRIAGAVPLPARRLPVAVTSTCAAGVETRHLRLGATWTLRATLLLPARAPRAPGGVPVYLLQQNHAAWARAALDRGWGACLVSAGDGDDDTEDVEAAVGGALSGGPVAGRLAWRAWALSRVLDALEEQPGVDARRVLVGGHSRNGKAALLAAAFDDRFAGVVSSSSGVLGAIPARLCTDRHFGEGVELLTRHYPGWYHPRLRWFSGREHLLPTDTHELVALAAPRPVLVSVATGDPVERVPAARLAVEAARDAHALLGAPDAITLALRPGGHGADEAAVQAQLDWADAALATSRTRPRGVAPGASRPSGPPVSPSVPWPAAPSRPGRGAAVRGEELRRAVRDALGPLDVDGSGGGRRSAGPDRPRVPSPRLAPAGEGELVLRARRGLAVTLLRARPGAPARGLALWLGPACAATGWRAGYEQAEPLPEQLAAAGWDVACHDPVASGSRHDELLPAGGSPLGRMTADAAEVARAAMAVTGAAGAWVAAYGTGALVALHLVALGEVRVLGAALAAPSCGEPLLRAAPAYGLTDLLAALAGRPALVLDPAWDPVSPPGAVAAACRAAGVERTALDDWHRLSAAARTAVVAWLDERSALLASQPDAARPAGAPTPCPTR